MEIDRLRGGKKLLNVIKVFGESNESGFFLHNVNEIYYYIFVKNEKMYYYADLRTI